MEIIGHRGAAAIAPENTLASLAAALEIGPDAPAIDAVEFDVRCTADDVAVLLHDGTLERTTDGRGRVEELALADLARVDAGRPFGEAFAGERIPTLARAMELVAGRVEAIVELKTEGTPRDDALATIVCRTLREASTLHPLEKVVVSAKHWPPLEVVRSELPEAAVAPIFGGLELRDPVAAARRIRARAIHANRRRCDVRFVERSHAAGLRVRAYTVNEGAQLDALRRVGVDGVFSDDPGALVDHLATDPGADP